MAVRGVEIAGVFVEFDDDDKPRRRSSEDLRDKVERRMAVIDGLSREQRMVVHEHGWCLVKTFLDHGVTSPRSMRALINAVIHNVIDRKDRPSD